MIDPWHLPTGSTRSKQERPGFNVYLVDSRRGHCLCLTDDFASADGLALAEVVD